MSVDWQSFKSSLGNLNDVALAYIDDEGTEIPIECEMEFQEALKFAKSNGQNQLRIILKSKQVNNSKNSIVLDAASTKEVDTNNLKVNDNSVKMYTCQPHENRWNHNSETPPLWFSQHIKKFKKKLLEEIKGNINEAVHNAFKKEMKALKMKMENSEKVHILSCASLNRNKTSSKECTSLGCEQREKKLRKIEKYDISRVHKFHVGGEKLDVKTKELADERFKHEQHKSSLEGKRLKPWQPPKMLSATFETPNIKTHYQTGQDISIELTIKNTGMIPWKNAKVVCWVMEGLTLDKTCFNLNHLLPGDQCIVRLMGKVALQIGVYRLKCRIYEGSEELCRPLVCTIRVVDKNEPSIQALSPALKSLPSYQKKIEENIGEIEKRLQNISFQSTLPPGSGFFTALETERKNPVSTSQNPSKPTEICRHTPKDQPQDLTDRKPDDNKHTSGCEPLQHSEVKEPLVEDEPLPQSGMQEDTDSDSDLSIIYVSDEEENFIVIPMPNSLKEEREDSKASAAKEEPSTSVATTEPERESSTTTTKAEPFRENDPSREKRVFRGRAKKKLKKTGENQSFATRSRSPFGPDTDECKAKKLKSSSEHRFTGSNLTQPTFLIRPENGKRDKKETEKRKKFKNAFRNGKATLGKVRTTDSAGKLIFAVDSAGQCRPFLDVLRREGCDGETSPVKSERSKHGRRETEKGKESHSGRADGPGEGMGEASVNILPGVLMNGATNMASLALNTAKSVINNLHSAFVAEGKTEEDRPDCETKRDREPTMETMFNLFEMGFRKMETNRLLMNCGNDLSKVMEDMMANGGDSSPKNEDPEEKKSTGNIKRKK